MLKQQFLSAVTDNFPLFTGVGQAQYDALGDIRIESGGSGQAAYKFLRFTGTTATAAGDFLCYTDTSLQIADGANAASFGGAGVAMAAIASGAVSLGWVQITGKATLNTNMGATAPAAGNMVTHVGATAKTVQALVVTSTTQLQGIVGRALNATNLVVLDLPLG